MAIAVRSGYLWEIPRFTDEIDEVALAARIARGQALPLTNVDPYIGALWNYLLAAPFLLVGPNIYSSRVVALVLGALTVVPTYLLGRSFGGHGVGLLAGAMMALAPVHVLLNSHIAWSNCLTPLFSTAALWLLHHALTAGRVRALAGSGLFFGLALQTHPTVAFLLPGAVVYLVMKQPGWLRSRWSFAALGLVVLTCSNVLLENVRHNPATIPAVDAVRTEYTFGEVLSPALYAQRELQLVRLLADSVGGLPSDPSRIIGPFDAVVMAGRELLVIGGLVLAARRLSWLPHLTVLSMALLLPVVNAKYDGLHDVWPARFLVPLLPLCYTTAALALWRVRSVLGKTDTITKSGRSRAGQAAFALAVVMMLAGPLRQLRQYYQQAERDGFTNALLLETVQALGAVRRPGERVYLDSGLHFPTAPLGKGGFRSDLEFAAAIYGWPWQTVELQQPAARSRAPLSGLLVVDASNEAIARQLYQLEPVVELLEAGAARQSTEPSASPGAPTPLVKVFRTTG